MVIQLFLIETVSTRAKKEKTYMELVGRDVC